MWNPSEVLDFSFSTWEKLGGTIEQPPKGGWHKLMHPAFDSKHACVVIDLKGGTFDHFTNVRIRTRDLWLQVRWRMTGKS